MAEPLKNSLPFSLVEDLSHRLAADLPSFDEVSFLERAGNGWDRLELMARGERVAEALREASRLPFPVLAASLGKTLGPELEKTEGNGMTPFRHLPFSFFLARFGLEFPEEALDAMHGLTRRFTAEFCIRPYLQHHRDRTMARLSIWTRDPSPHVRRLVSEGTRPRLPWASRLREFQQDPSLALPLLETLKDDPHPYVRRSVANHLADIGKDHPRVLFDTARAWWPNGSTDRRKMLEHALRTFIKAGHPEALDLIGYGDTAQVEVSPGSFHPRSPRRGESTKVTFSIENPSPRSQDLLVDLRLDAMKANGTQRPRVFKLRRLTLGAGSRETLQAQLSFREMTTRTHHPGRHTVFALINGVPHLLGSFTLRP
ncbi:MAG: DNA alkylation repair protein [Fibrobacteria bacterium]|nr:DNA alkylation repair protein [Fibrobacteria bacterium]